MTCAACAGTVHRALNNVDGVRASVNFATRTATLDITATDIRDTVTVESLCQIVEQAGYLARPRRQHPFATEDPAAERARDLLRRLAVAALLFVPLVALSVLFAMLPNSRFPGWGWLLVVLAAPIVTWAAWPFHRVALKNLRHGNASMETLISIGISAAALWSLYRVFFTSDTRVYLEVAAGVTGIRPCRQVLRGKSRVQGGRSVAGPGGTARRGGIGATARRHRIVGPR